MAGKRLAGVAFLTIDGKSYQVAEGAKYQVSKITRETLSGQSGVDGFKEMPKPGTIGATIRDAGDLSVSKINQMTDVTVVLQLANGKVISGSGMWSTENQEVDTAEGKFEVNFEGPDVRED
jgi:hypothetical protein